MSSFTFGTPGANTGFSFGAQATPATSANTSFGGAGGFGAAQSVPQSSFPFGAATATMAPAATTASSFSFGSTR